MSDYPKFTTDGNVSSVDEFVKRLKDEEYETEI